MQAVGDLDELMMITARGYMLRTDLSAVREIGRATQGVRLIRLKTDDKVVAVAKVAPEEEEKSGGTPAEEGNNSPENSDGTGKTPTDGPETPHTPS